MKLFSCWVIYLNDLHLKLLVPDLMIWNLHAQKVNILKETGKTNLPWNRRSSVKISLLAPINSWLQVNKNVSLSRSYLLATLKKDLHVYFQHLQSEVPAANKQGSGKFFSGTPDPCGPALQINTLALHFRSGV